MAGSATLGQSSRGRSWRLTGMRGSIVVVPAISRFYGIVIAMYFDDHGPDRAEAERG